MIRPFAAALVLGSCSAAALAQSSVSLYGLMDMSAGQFQSPGGLKTWRAESGNMTTSYIGFRGTEDLGGGAKALFRIEHFMRLDVGGAGRFGADAFWARNAVVGLEGGFGTTTLGRNTTPLFVSTLIFNAFGDSFGFSPSIRHYFLGAVLADTGWNNSIRYGSPNFSGFTFSGVANVTEGSGVSKNLGANLLYFGGPFAATLAWQDVGNGIPAVPAGFDGQTTWQLGGSYDLKVVKLFAQLGESKTKATVDTKTELASVSASVPLAGGNVLAAYGTAKATTGTVETTRKTLTVGYDYFLSKSTDLYAVVMNEKVTNLEDGNTFAVGLRVRF